MEQLSDFFKMLQNKDKNKSQFIYISSLGRVSKSELVRKYIVEYSKKSYDNRIIQIYRENAKSYEIFMNFFYNLPCDTLGIINVNNKEKKLCSIIEDVYKYLLRTGLVKQSDKLTFIFNNSSIQQSDNNEQEWFF